MRKLIIITILMTSLLTACFSNEAAYPNPSYPNPEESSDNYRPDPADANLSRGAAYVDSVELLTMESLPLQFSLHLKGTLPTPCHKLRVSANLPDPENKIRIDVYSIVDPNVVCTQVLE